MANIAPNIGEIKLCATGGSPANILQVTKAKITVKGRTFDTTSTDGAGWDTHLVGETQNNWTMQVTARWETTEATLFGNPPTLSIGQGIDIELYHDEANYANEKWTGSGTVTSFDPPEIDTASGDALTYTFELQGSGALTPPASA